MNYDNKKNKYKLIFFFILFIIFISYLFHRCKVSEGLTSYNDEKPTMHTIYNDKNGIEISKLGDYGKCLIIQNEIQLCEKEEIAYHELIVHLPIMYLPNQIKNVVIIGGGDLMTLREIMRYYTIENVFMLELDKTIVDLCEEYFNQSKYDDDPRVRIIYGDANITIDKILEDYKDSIDFIVVDTTEDNEDNTSVDSPDFFDKCMDLLNDDGVLVKNGSFFKIMLEGMYPGNTISYNVDIPYFQEKYYFTIVSKTDNNIKSRDINMEYWLDYSIPTKVYDPEEHNKYLIFEEYV